MQLHWKYKDGNRCYWNIVAKATGASRKDEYNDPNFWDLEWACAIYYDQVDANSLDHVVWEDLLYGQYDENINVQDILREWMASNTSVAMGISKYSRPIVVKDEENDSQ